jgi:hypothetical protein
MGDDGFEVRLSTTAPLRGVVIFGDHEPRPFEGWVSLAAAVQAIVADAAPAQSSRAA